MSEVPNKPKRDRVVMAMTVMAVLSLTCGLGIPTLLFGTKFAWPRIRNSWYQRTH